MPISHLLQEWEMCGTKGYMTFVEIKWSVWNTSNLYVNWYRIMNYFIWLKPTPNLKLTLNLDFSLPCHFYIHDQQSNQAVTALTEVVNMYLYPNLWKLVQNNVFAYLYLAQTDNKPQNLAFSLSSPLHQHSKQAVTRSGDYVSVF